MISSFLNDLIGNFLETCKKIGEKPLLILLGPTASGKSALSIAIAQQFNGEIISADSRQVYRHMDIGTDKISEEKREGIPHYLIDIVDPKERFTLADFKKLAEAKIEDILRRGKLPMLVGGTGLYINAISQNFALPPENPTIRSELIKELEEFGSEELYKKLEQLDPISAAKIHPRNIPYIVRALEIIMVSGQAKTDRKDPPRYRYLKIGLRWPTDLLFERIHKRIDEQIERGLVEETKKLLGMGYSRDLPSMRSIGYFEIAAYFNSELSFEDAKATLKKNTRDFAKRQMTWFKRDREIVWLNQMENSS